MDIDIYKKGQSTSIWSIMLFPVIALFIFGVMTVIGYHFITESHDAWRSTGFLTDVTEKVFTNFSNAILFFDWFAVILMVVLIMAGVYWMHLLSQKPLFFLGAFIMVPFIGLIGVIFNYMFMQFISTDVLFTVAQSFPKLVIIATNLHWIALVLFVLGTILTLSMSDNNRRLMLGQ